MNKGLHVDLYSCLDDGRIVLTAKLVRMSLSGRLETKVLQRNRIKADVRY